MKKKHVALLLITLLVFISLGIPDGVLGAAWPQMSVDLGLSLEFVGYVSSVIFLASFISSLSYTKICEIFNFAQIILISILLTIIGSFLFMLVSNNIILFIAAVIIGLGAGSIDTAVNDFASKRFSVGTINVLHGCWGIGISGGSYIVSSVFYFELGWKYAYLIVAVIQISILLLFLSRKKLFSVEKENVVKQEYVKIKFKHLLGCFYYFFYGIEYVIGLYLSSYVLFTANIVLYQASIAIGLYWTGLTVGRFFVLISSKKLSNYQIIISSLIISIVSGFALLIVDSYILIVVSCFILGFGLAPLYPTMVSQTSNIFPSLLASKLIALQVSAAMLGVFILPIIAGYLFKIFSLNLFPLIVIFQLLLMLIVVMLIKTLHKTKSF